jgi:chemotaxis protein methyltransferase CheR
VCTDGAAQRPASESFMDQFSDATFRKISSLMYDAVGLSFNESKKPLIMSRLRTRFDKLGLSGLAQYVDLLADEANAAEFQMAVDLLTTNETYFFREPKHYEFLEKDLANQKDRQPLTVWSAASSFGDEAYSTAMLLSDMQVSGRVAGGWSILGTDISHRVLLAAKAAIYPTDRLRNVSPERLRRYCLRGEGESAGQIMMQDKLRERVRFGQLNLCQPYSGIGPFDVIFLRNVLIYFDVQTKQEVVDRALAQLKPGGLFFLGTAEGRVKCETPLLSVQPGIFRKPF